MVQLILCQMQTPSGEWIDVPMVENGFACNGKGLLIIQS
jgi:hypothetical protein